jgi:ribosomal protein S18 acetylase RimI-like enzyme
VDVRSLAYRTDLALLRLAGSEIDDRGSHIVVRTPDNPGFRWGNFYLLPEPPGHDEVGDVVAAYDADFPQSSHRAFGIDGTEPYGDALTPLVGVGLEADTGTVMTATSVRPPPRPNSDAVYRRLESDDDWKQRVEVSIAINNGEIDPERYARFIKRRAEAERRLAEASHGAWWGAFLDGRLATHMGLVDAGDGLARYQSVETHPELRGRGLAGTLVHRVATYGFEELAARTLVMVADPEYSAIRIYRSVGFDGTEAQTELNQPDRDASG